MIGAGLSPAAASIRIPAAGLNRQESVIKEIGLPLAAAFVAAFAVARALLAPAAARFALDRPNPRSLHAAPVPRSGGVAVMAGIAIGAALLPGQQGLVPIAAGALLMFVVGVADDVRGLAPAWRLIAQLVAAGISLWPLQAALGSLALCAILALAVMWVTNLYNFMDGSDGLAAGMAVIGFGAYAIAAGLAGDAQLAALASAIAAAALAFLRWNFHPARIFLGDCGSLPLGFLAAGVGVLGAGRGHWTLVFPLLAFAPFIADASLTLARRLLKREHVWRAHRDHYYQRLVRMGCGHRGVALGGYALMLGSAATAIAGRALTVETQIAALAGWSLAFLAMAQAVDLRWRRFADKARHEAA